MHLFYLLLCLSLSFLAVPALGADSNDYIDFTTPVVADADYEPPPLPPLEPPVYPPGNHQQPYLPTPPRMDVGVDAAGNIQVRLAGAHRASLQEAVNEAAKVCSVGAKIRKRDLVGCMVNQANAYVDHTKSELFDPAQLHQFKLRFMHGFAEFGDLVQRLPEIVDLNRALLFLGAAFQTQTVGWTVGGLGGLALGSGAVKLGQTMTFKPVKEGDEDEEPKPDPEPTEEPAPTTTSASCRPTGKDEFPTDCEEDDCKGGDDEKCTVGEEKGCPCAIYGEVIVDEYDKEFGDLQQELFKKLYEDPPEPTTTEPPNPCETQEVEVPGKCGVPQCQYVIAADKGINALCEEDYCFCEGVAVALITATKDDKTSLGCGYETLPTEDACPTKTEDAPPEETSEPPKVNKPGNREYCSKNPDCRKFTCDEEGRHPTCNYDVDFGNSWCRCDEVWEE